MRGSLNDEKNNSFTKKDSKKKAMTKEIFRLILGLYSRDCLVLVIIVDMYGKIGHISYLDSVKFGEMDSGTRSQINRTFFAGKKDVNISLSILLLYLALTFVSFPLHIVVPAVQVLIKNKGGTTSFVWSNALLDIALKFNGFMLVNKPKRQTDRLTDASLSTRQKLEINQNYTDEFYKGGFNILSHVDPAITYDTAKEFIEECSSLKHLPYFHKDFFIVLEKNFDATPTNKFSFKKMKSLVGKNETTTFYRVHLTKKQNMPEIMSQMSERSIDLSDDVLLTRFDESCKFVHCSFVNGLPHSTLAESTQTSAIWTAMILDEDVPFYIDICESCHKMIKKNPLFCQVPFFCTLSSFHRSFFSASSL